MSNYSTSEIFLLEQSDLIHELGCHAIIDLVPLNPLALLDFLRPSNKKHTIEEITKT